MLFNKLAVSGAITGIRCETLNLVDKLGKAMIWQQRVGIG